MRWEYHSYFVPGPGNDAEALSEENLDGCGRYPSRVRTWYFWYCWPTSFTLMVRQPRLGLGRG